MRFVNTTSNIHYVSQNSRPDVPPVSNEPERFHVSKKCCNFKRKHINVGKNQCFPNQFFLSFTVGMEDGPKKPEMAQLEPHGY